MVVATWLAIRLGARLFRVGLLLTGARPKLREILRQARRHCQVNKNSAD